MTKDDHGRTSTYENHGCRCDACKAAHRAKNSAAQKRRLSGAVPKGVKHGETTYKNYGCRCDVCTAANTNAGRVRRHAKKRGDK